MGRRSLSPGAAACPSFPPRVQSGRLFNSQSVGLEGPYIRLLRNPLVSRHVGMTGRARRPQQDRVAAGLSTLDRSGELELVHRYDAVIVPRSRDQSRRVASAGTDVMQRRVGIEPFE